MRVLMLTLRFMMEILFQFSCLIIISLCIINSGINLDHNSPPSLTDISSSAAHRGILSLHCALLLCKKHLSIVNESLPSLLEVVFALWDVNALPPRLGDLDDFADSKGNSLPPSIFLTKSSAKINAYKKSLSESTSSDAAPSSGLFSFLGFVTIHHKN